MQSVRSHTTIIQVSDASQPARVTREPTGWTAIDHVQLAMPRGGEDAARAFYDAKLGIPEVPKPPLLAVRGGCWFEAGIVRIHLGVEDDFRPARKAHPALRVAELQSLVERTGLDVTWADDVAGVLRCHIADPFGNRIELIDDPTDGSARSPVHHLADACDKAPAEEQPDTACVAGERSGWS